MTPGTSSDIDIKNRRRKKNARVLQQEFISRRSVTDEEIMMTLTHGRCSTGEEEDFIPDDGNND